MNTALTVILIFGALWSFLFAVRTFRRMSRRRAISAVTEPTRVAEDVGVHILLHRTRAIQGMDPGKAHQTLGDLAISPERLVLATDRGVLLDMVHAHGHRFTGVRCTGPGRLVLEGKAPAKRGEGLYRFELTLEDAGPWVELLRPFVEDGGAITIHPAVAARLR
jgi:hypothetical protein